MADSAMPRGIVDETKPFSSIRSGEEAQPIAVPKKSSVVVPMKRKASRRIRIFDPSRIKIRTSPEAFRLNPYSSMGYSLPRSPIPARAQGPYMPGGKKSSRKSMKTKNRGGMNLRASTLEKRARVEAKIKEKEELASKRRMVAMQKKQEKSSATPEELDLAAARAAVEANRLQAEAERLAEALRRARDTPRELDELTALLERMEVGGRRTRRQKARRTRRRV